MDSFSLISKSADNVIRKENKRAQRRAKREHVIKFAEYLHQDEKEMLTLWLADKVLDAVGDDELSNDAITVAQEQIQK